MITTPLKKLQFPIGAFECPENITNDHIAEWIKDLELLPNRLSALVENLSAEQLNTPYRPEGWTVRQLVHHIADSHHHSYIRFKWTLTEDTPIIKAYEEKDWSELFDAKTAPVSLSLNYLKALHAKLVYLLKGLSEKDLDKKFIHPESKSEVVLRENIGIYAWHSNHHLAHIQGLVDKNGW